MSVGGRVIPARADTALFTRIQHQAGVAGSTDHLDSIEHSREAALSHARNLLQVKAGDLVGALKALRDGPGGSDDLCTLPKAPYLQQRTRTSARRRGRMMASEAIALSLTVMFPSPPVMTSDEQLL